MWLSKKLGLPFRQQRRIYLAGCVVAAKSLFNITQHNRFWIPLALGSYDVVPTLFHPIQKKHHPSSRLSRWDKVSFVSLRQKYCTNVHLYNIVEKFIETFALFGVNACLNWTNFTSIVEGTVTYRYSCQQLCECACVWAYGLVRGCSFCCLCVVVCLCANE